MDALAAIFHRVSTVTVLGLILTGFMASLSSVVNAGEITVAMAEATTATSRASTDNAQGAGSHKALSAALIEEVRNDLDRRHRIGVTQLLKAD